MSKAFTLEELKGLKGKDDLHLVISGKGERARTHAGGAGWYSSV